MQIYCSKLPIFIYKGTKLFLIYANIPSEKFWSKCQAMPFCFFFLKA